jgi:hypothetical protein
MTHTKGGLVRRLTISAVIAIACLTAPLAWAEPVKPASAAHVKSPTAKKTTAPAAKKKAAPAKKKKPVTVAKKKAPGAVHKAKAPAARPSVHRAVTGEAILV